MYATYEDLLWYQQVCPLSQEYSYIASFFFCCKWSNNGTSCAKILTSNRRLKLYQPQLATFHTELEKKNPEITHQL